jgi:hypothetical protein
MAEVSSCRTDQQGSVLGASSVTRPLGFGQLLFEKNNADLYGKNNIRNCLKKVKHFFLALHSLNF